MIRMEKQGLEFYEKLAEIKRLEQREGAVLMMHDVDTQKLHEIETDFLLDDLEDEDSWES